MQPPIKKFSVTMTLLLVSINLMIACQFEQPESTTTSTATIENSIPLSTHINEETSTQAPTLPNATVTKIPSPTETPIPLGFSGNPVYQNSDWSPVVRNFDGVEMVLVPAGCFTMGSEVRNNERPPHAQCFQSPFWIDRYEVTNAQYGSFGTWAGDNMPRETLTWFEARDHCDSRGSRLPTEAEWEYAARGPDGWMYPWGNEFDGTRLNFCDAGCGYDWQDWNYNDGYKNTAPVGSYPTGVSWVGAYDMAGNVYEWVSTIFTWYPYDPTDVRAEFLLDPTGHRVLRGGSYFNYAYAVRSTYRFKDPPTIVYDIFGFRCARDY